MWELLEDACGVRWGIKVTVGLSVEERCFKKTYAEVQRGVCVSTGTEDTRLKGKPIFDTV
jgi:hypothetical protein